MAVSLPFPSSLSTHLLAPSRRQNGEYAPYASKVSYTGSNVPLLPPHNSRRLDKRACQAKAATADHSFPAPSRSDRGEMSLLHSTEQHQQQ